MGDPGPGRCRHENGPTSVELEEIKQLKKENRDLKEINEVLKAATTFFARELDPRHR